MQSLRSMRSCHRLPSSGICCKDSRFRPIARLFNLIYRTILYTSSDNIQKSIYSQLRCCLENLTIDDLYPLVTSMDSKNLNVSYTGEANANYKYEYEGIDQGRNGPNHAIDEVLLKASKIPIKF